MMFRTLLPALLLLPVLAPQVADACSPAFGFTISNIYPRAGEFFVPTDGVVVVVGEGWSGAGVKIEVRLAGELVEGSVTASSDDRYVWLASAPLLPETQYSVRVEAEAPDGLDVREHDFTTGTEPAPVLEDQQPYINDMRVEAFEQEVRECVVEGGIGSCESCETWKVVDVETRLRLQLSINTPGYPFEGNFGSTVRYGRAASLLEASTGTVFEPGTPGATFHTIDLGLAGSVEGSQVCARADIVDPLGRSAKSVVECRDISTLNIAPDEDTDTEDTEDSSSGGEESGDFEGPGQDITIGCDVGGSGGPAWPALLLLLGVGSLRRRR